MRVLALLCEAFSPSSLPSLRNPTDSGIVKPELNAGAEDPP